LTDSPLFHQACNGDKYLKVSKEQMRQLMEGSRHAAADDNASKRASASGGCTQSPQTIYNPDCQCLEEPEFAGESATLANGTALQVSAIPPGVLDKAELTCFYCCSRCGKVFWEGSHFGRVVSQFKDVLAAMEDDQRFYELS
ncbi:MUT7 Exonuclease, partial [Nothocercus julius]|nr:MUT7 Exonuclease [Nothocercus julius]